MRERLISVVTPAQIGNEQKPQEPTLTESLREKELPRRRRQARDIIDRMDIPLEQKRLLFFYHLWHETGSFGPIKEFGDIREDPTINSMLNRVMESDSLVQKYDEFYLKYKEIIAPQNKQSIEKTKKEKVPFSEEEAEEFLFQEVENTSQIFVLKQQGKTNKQIAEELGISNKRTETIVRALIFFKKIPPTLSGEKIVSLQDHFLRQVRDLRLQKLGNQEIADKLGVGLEKVEHAASFLLWLKMIERIKKGDALRTRWKRKAHKKEIREFLGSLDFNKRISIRTMHKTCGIDIGYDQFLSIFHELEKEQKAPPIRKSSIKSRRNKKPR